MEDTRRLEKEWVEAKEINDRNNLRWHNSIRAEQAKVEKLEREMARIAHKFSIAGSPRRKKTI